MSSDRDRIVEQALAHELARARSTAGGACLDAEMLAAWEDNALDANTVAALESHVAACARCQALTAAFVRSAESLGSTAPALEVRSPRRSFFGAWKWLTPLAAGAAAVTLWMIVPEQQEVAVTPPTALAATIESETAATPTPQAQEATPLESRRQPARADRSEAKQQDATAAQNTIAAQDAARPNLPEARKERAEEAAASPASPASSAPAVVGFRANARVAFTVEIVSPDGKQRWRVSAAGVERSLDAGGTWSLVHRVAANTYTSGMSPAPGVCWLIGNNGAVLLTTSGDVFTRVDIPGGGNLRSITAMDARSATVITASGQTFRTDDGGGTWR